MKILSMVVCASLAFGAAGCEKKSNPNTGGGSTSGTAAPQGADAGKPTTPGPGPTPAAPATDAKQDTPVGAMRLFIDRMGRGEFGAALAFVDPSCQLHGEISSIVSKMEEAQKRNPDNSASAIDMIRASFSPPYRGAEASLVSEEEGRAMVELKRVGFPPANVAMTKGDDGDWFVSAKSEEGLFAPAFGGGKPGAPSGDGGGSGGGGGR